MPNKLHIDLESYSELDLKKVGLYKYAAHPSTEITMCAFALDERPVELWDCLAQTDAPFTLLKWLKDPEIELHAFNAAFERIMIRDVWKLDLSTERYHCSMVHAWSLSFSGGLGQIAHQMGLPQDLQKDKDGAKLIQKFCKPAPSNHKATRYDPHNSPDEWARFKDYCTQDVVAERAISKLLQPYAINETERLLWLADQAINDRGLPIDMAVVEGAIKIYHEEKKRLGEKMNELTFLSNANSIPQLSAWAATRGVTLLSLAKDNVISMLKKDIPADVREVLELRLRAAKTSASKWEALLRATMDDGRLRGTLAFGGAQRTQRWAGRIFQPHNLPRPKADDIDKTADILATGNRDLIEALYGDVMQFLTDHIRAAVTAPEGKTFVVSDLSSIESRKAGWLTGCTRINKIFEEGKDTYKDFAMEVYHVSYDEVDKDQRHFSKPAVLGSCYGLGAKGLGAYAEGYGVVMDADEAKRITDLYRRTYPEIKEAWYWLSDTCKKVIEHEVKIAHGCGVHIYRDTNFLFIELPSRRRIAYYRPTIEMQVPPWELAKEKEQAELGLMYEPQTIPAITYMGMNQYTRKWTRQSTHGGKIMENICQGSSRDILAENILEAECDPEMSTVLHVHDELVALVDDDKAVVKLDELETIMSKTPLWAPGLILDAKGFISKRYKKD